MFKRDYMQQLDWDKLKKEMQALKNLDHPNILKLFELFRDHDYFYLVTEKCQGKDLFDELQQI